MEGRAPVDISSDEASGSSIVHTMATIPTIHLLTLQVCAPERPPFAGKTGQGARCGSQLAVRVCYVQKEAAAIVQECGGHRSSLATQDKHYMASWCGGQSVRLVMAVASLLSLSCAHAGSAPAALRGPAFALTHSPAMSFGTGSRHGVCARTPLLALHMGRRRKGTGDQRSRWTTRVASDDPNAPQPEGEDVFLGNGENRSDSYGLDIEYI
jgi:hypothetical protein